MICGVCLREPPPFDRAVSFGLYEGDLRRLVHLLKYDGMRALARPLGERLAAAIERERWEFDLAAPVPLAFGRRWSRGFNQAALVGKRVAERRGARFEKRLLRRTRATYPQAGLNRAERERNLREAIAVRDPAAVRGRAVLLVDDVMTTGATLAACARALKSAGAKWVGAATVARAELEARRE